jgi:hypothetical protein
MGGQSRQRKPLEILTAFCFVVWLSASIMTTRFNGFLLFVTHSLPTTSMNTDSPKHTNAISAVSVIIIAGGDNHQNRAPIQNGTVVLGTLVILFRWRNNSEN